VSWVVAFALLVGGIVLVVAGAELFFEGLLTTAARLGVSAFALTALVSGFELENIAAGIAANVKGLENAAAGTFLGGTTFLAPRRGARGLRRCLSFSSTWTVRSHGSTAGRSWAGSFWPWPGCGVRDVAARRSHRAKALHRPAGSLRACRKPDRSAKTRVGVGDHVSDGSGDGA
jgi:hypothetical protein